MTFHPGWVLWGSAWIGQVEERSPLLAAARPALWRRSIQSTS